VTAATETRTYAVTFERIGRRRDLPVEQFNVVDAEDLAGKVWKFARWHLGSRDYVVTVDLEQMRGWIEGGRFGAFTIAEVTP
jgi:hypothetical protein